MNLEVIIKDINNGEEILHTECDCIVGALAGVLGEEQIAVHGIRFVKGKVFSVISAIREAERAVEDYKRKICEDFEKTCGASINFDELTKVAETFTMRAEVDEEAIKAMKERAEQ